MGSFFEPVRRGGWRAASRLFAGLLALSLMGPALRECHCRAEKTPAGHACRCSGTTDCCAKPNRGTVLGISETLTCGPGCRAAFGSDAAAELVSVQKLVQGSVSPAALVVPEVAVAVPVGPSVELRPPLLPSRSHTILRI